MEKKEFCVTVDVAIYLTHIVHKFWSDMPIKAKFDGTKQFEKFLLDRWLMTWKLHEVTVPTSQIRTFNSTAHRRRTN